MFPTTENIIKHKIDTAIKIKNQSLENFANVGNLLIENFIKNKNIDTLKLIIYLAKLNTEFNNVIEEVDDGNEIVNFEVPIEEICLFFNINKESFRKKLYNIRRTEVSFYCKDECGVFEGSVFPAMIIKKEVVKIKMFRIVFKELKKDLQNQKEKGFTNIKFLDRLMKLKRFNAYRMFIFLNRIRDYKYQNKIMNLDHFNGYFDVNYKSLNEVNKNILKPLKEDLDGFIPFTYEKVYDESTTGPGRKPLIAYKIYYKGSIKEELDDNTNIIEEVVQNGIEIDSIDDLDSYMDSLEPEPEEAIEERRTNRENDGSTALRKSMQDLKKGK